MEFFAWLTFAKMQDSLYGHLVLETGLGEGAYQHQTPAVHGLWPEVSPYGQSECVRPQDTSFTFSQGRLPSCYQDASFLEHEWSKHGMCSGARSDADYFEQICDLSNGPLQVLQQLRQQGQDLDAMASALSAQGYAVAKTDAAHQQIYLWACAKPTDQSSFEWHLAAPEDFGTVCGAESPGSDPQRARRHHHHHHHRERWDA